MKKLILNSKNKLLNELKVYIIYINMYIFKLFQVDNNKLFE